MYRNANCYKAYLLAPEEDKAPPIPYSTWKRWLLTGRITEERLKALGINTRQRKGRKKISEKCATLPAGEEANAAHHTQDSSPHRLEDQSASSAPHDEPCASILSNSLTEANSHCSSVESNISLSSLSDTSTENNCDGLSENDDDLSPENSRLLSILNSKFTKPETLNELLHPALSVTKFETLMMILHMSMRHRMTDVFLDDLLSFVNLIIPNSLRFSKHLFHKLFMFGAESKVHFFCPNCDKYFGCEKSHPDGIIDCGDCEWNSTVSSMNSGNYFLTLGLREQIRDILTRPGVKFVSRERLQHVISDLMDGKVYSSLTKGDKVLSQPNALTLTMNTDGSPVFKSGPNSLWPVHFYINEIEPSKRFSADNILLGGLWFGKCEANLQMFLKPIMTELKELEQCGVVWKKNDGTVVESPIYVTCCCCDSVARPKVQHHMQFNGAFGCTLCLHPNESITVVEEVDPKTGLLAKNKKNKKKTKQQVSSRQNRSSNGEATDEVILRAKKIMRYIKGQYQMRTNRELRENMELASANLVPHIMGSTGKSVLCNLRHFNVVYGFAIDYMHAILLGTVRRVTGFWFDSVNHEKPYHIGLCIDRIDSRLQSITLPSGFRPPRPMSDRVHWKANEWRAFLLYFALPVLFNILPLPFFLNFRKLVSAIYLLVKESILQDEVEEAHQLLLQFVDEFQDLYGEENMVYNVHLTSHLGQMVAQMGPLWSYSAFPFESANGRLVKMAMGTRGVATQISRKFLMSRSACKLIQNNYRVKDEVLDFCCKIVGYKYLKNASKGSNSETLLGREFYYHLNRAQRQAFINGNLPVPDPVLVVNRVVVDGRLYHSRLTTRQNKACDSCIRLSSGEFALIDLIILEHKPDTNIIRTSFLVTILNIAKDPSPLLVPHIKQCSLDSFGDLKIVTCDEISRKCIFYSCYDRRFVAEIANFYELD